jgi:hypothetical protein
MAVQPFNQVAYGLTQPGITVFPPPIVSDRAPLGSDKAPIGQTWVVVPLNDYYVLTSIVANVATWQLVVAGGGALNTITTNAGVVAPVAGNINLVGGGATNITTSGAGATATVAVISSPSFAGTTTVATGLVATTGNIVATAGQVNAGTSMTAGTFMSAGTTVTAGTGITATTGNITASTGNIVATAGAVQANTTVTAGTTLVGTLGITISAFTAGAIVSDNVGVFSSIAGTAGQILTSNGAGVAPSFQGAGSAPVSIVQTAVTPYVVTATDYFIASDSSAAIKTVQLPDAPATGRVFVVKDYTGSAAAFNITVTTVGGAVLIDGAASYVLNTNYQSVQVIFDGAAYEVY